jgi:hypothetical protein
LRARPAIRRRSTPLVAFAIASAIALVGAADAVAEVIHPLPRSSYGIRAACTQPPPEAAGCLALQLVPRTAQARARTHPLGISRSGPIPSLSAAAGDYGLRPQDLHSAYQLPTAASSAQTIALVDAYNDPTAEADLLAYSEEFSLPACTTANGCFRQVNQSGHASPLPFPSTKAELEAARKGTLAQRERAEEATGWGVEISLDIEAAHASCQSCHILLVEAESPSFEDLVAAEASAEALGANEVSDSWGAAERGISSTLESGSAFNHPGTVITAAAGDYGYLNWDSESSLQREYADFPASSPHVVAVGGTRLAPLGVGGSYSEETVWNGDGAGGGGCSRVFTAPAWQQSVGGWASVGCASRRAVADVAADADPYSGVAVYDSASPECEHWCTIGGTSLSSPLIAAVYALAGGAGGVSYPARTLYAKAGTAGSLHDVTSGSNGECATPFQEPSLLSSCTLPEEAASCSSHAICLAGSGYDGPSGVGTPQGTAAFQAPPGGESELPGGAESPGPAARSEEPQLVPAPPPSVSAPAPPPPPPAPSGPPRTSSLGLTLGAVVALNRARPRSSQLVFSFTISAPARVRASLAKRRRGHGHTRWRPMRASRSFFVAAGAHTARLAGRTVLTRGVYRLTLAPLHGIARSMLIRIG